MNIPKSAIYTRTGDKGETSFRGGCRVKKDDPRVAAYGTIDELNSVIGVALSYIPDQEMTDVLEKIQHDLFTLGAELASLNDGAPGNTPHVVSEHVRDIELAINKFDSRLLPMKTFILPRGNHAASFLQLARTVCRRAERYVVGLEGNYPVNPDLVMYLNRVSDLLFVLARYANKEGKEEAPVYKYYKK